MEIEKQLTVAAAPAKVWEMLLDPQVMGSCVPGMQSVEVISPTEYVGVIKVKISFISATFRLNTRIVEQRAPEYLRIEGTGEDASVASSLKQQSELFLAALPDGQTGLRMLVKVDVLGRLGAFGLSVMKTKADRMWDEFGQNLAARLGGGAPQAAPAVAPQASPPAPPAQAGAAAPGSASPASSADPVARVDGEPATRANVTDGGWWSRLLGGGRAAAGRSIRIELRRGDTALNVEWPVEGGADCAAWLRDVLR